jgi:tetratricopeptide (TPR) repeat protein
VEVLQEQGRWMESLDMLGGLRSSSNARRREDALVYTALAKTNLGVSTAQEVFERLPELVSIIRESAQMATRARAARVVAYVVGGSRNYDLSISLLEVVDTIPEMGLDPDSIGHLALARALLLYEAGQAIASMTVVREAIEKLRELGVANLVMAQLAGGLGTIHSGIGDYQAALDCHEKAFHMATRLGNDTLIRSMVGNLMLCCNRLGRYDQLVTWLNQVPPARGAEFSVMVESQIAFLTALSHVGRGRNELAEQAVATLESRLAGEIPRWMIQSWAFRKADVMWLIGRRAEALRIAQEEFRTSSNSLLSPAFAGPFARWLALTNRGHHSRDIQEILDSLRSHLERYDAIDQVEIVMAMRILGVDSAKWNPTAEDHLLREKLLRLPHAARVQLATLVDMPSYAMLSN